METFVASYNLTIFAFGIVGGLLLVQLIVADVAGILRGHTPGSEVTSGHSDFLFRAVRAHANTNESIAGFILLSTFAALSSGSPAWVNGASMVYVVGRIGHMCFYYSNVQLLRSIFFVISMLGLFALLGTGMLAWFN